VSHVVCNELAPFHHGERSTSIRLIVRNGQSGAHEPRAWQRFLCLSNTSRFLDACFPKRTLDHCRVDDSQSRKIGVNRCYFRHDACAKYFAGRRVDESKVESSKIIMENDTTGDSRQKISINRKHAVQEANKPRNRDYSDFGERARSKYTRKQCSTRGDELIKSPHGRMDILILAANRRVIHRQLC